MNLLTAGRVAISESDPAAFVLVDPGGTVPAGYKLVTDQAWLDAHVGELVRRSHEEVSARIAADERSVAERRRVAGLPPVAPVHPELVPELQAEYERLRH